MWQTKKSEKHPLAVYWMQMLLLIMERNSAAIKKLKSLDSYKSASVLHQRKISHVQCCSEHMEQATSTTTSNELAISTATASTTTSTAPINPPDGSATKGLFSAPSLAKSKAVRSLTFNLVDDSSKDRKPRTHRIITSDDSKSEWFLKLFFRIFWRTKFCMWHNY